MLSIGINVKLQNSYASHSQKSETHSAQTHSLWIQCGMCVFCHSRKFTWNNLNWMNTETYVYVAMCFLDCAMEIYKTVDTCKASKDFSNVHTITNPKKSFAFYMWKKKANSNKFECIWMNANGWTQSVIVPLYNMTEYMESCVNHKINVSRSVFTMTMYHIRTTVYSNIDRVI